MRWRTKLCTAALVLPLCACGGGDAPGDAPELDQLPIVLHYTGIAVADLNHDNRTDVAVCYSPLTSAPPHPGMVAVYLQSGSPGIFLSAVNYAVGNDANSVKISDLNGDGHLDIVTANTILATSGAGTSDVSVLYQDPTAPGRFFPARSFPTGTGPKDVSAGDLNGDGRTDLAVADNGNGISVLYHDPANLGSFLSPVAAGIPTAYSVEVADVNGDTRADIVGVGGAGAAILYQSALGTLSPGPTVTAGSGPDAVAVGDLNGDLLSDFAVANRGSGDGRIRGNLSLILQNPSFPETFLPAQPHATESSPSSVAVADFNGDGRLDIAVANSGDLGGNNNIIRSGATVHLQSPTTAGQFLPGVLYGGEGQVLGVAAGDMNGDGRTDIVLADSGGAGLLLQDPVRPGVFLSRRGL